MGGRCNGDLVLRRGMRMTLPRPRLALALVANFFTLTATHVATALWLPRTNPADEEARARFDSLEDSLDGAGYSKRLAAENFPKVPNCDCVSDCFAMLAPGLPNVQASYACYSGEHYPDNSADGQMLDEERRSMQERLCTIVVSDRGTEHLTTTGQFCATKCRPPANHCAGENGCDLGDRCVDRG
mmetsp:Transcript_2171/g.5077  ORF Transcript_2171/g.5077 Transcript_2171/m.5077 type:complete len:185 (+) Transcript_2171:137-691(+)|eukprot:g1825.t1